MQLSHIVFLGSVMAGGNAMAAEPVSIAKISSKLTVTYVECAGFGGNYYWNEDRAKLDLITNGAASRLYPLVREMYWSTPAAKEQAQNVEQAAVDCDARIKTDRAAFLAAIEAEMKAKAAAK